MLKIFPRIVLLEVKNVKFDPQMMKEDSETMCSQIAVVSIAPDRLWDMTFIIWYSVESVCGRKKECVGDGAAAVGYLPPEGPMCKTCPHLSASILISSSLSSP